MKLNVRNNSMKSFSKAEGFHDKDFNLNETLKLCYSSKKMGAERKIVFEQFHVSSIVQFTQCQCERL